MSKTPRRAPDDNARQSRRHAAIVFGPRPYVLVVLVRGRDASVREPVIAEVARQAHLVLAQP